MHAIFGKVISRHKGDPDPAEVKALMDMAPPKTKRELQPFLGIINYLSKFSPMTAEICELLRRLTSVNAAWTWNRLYQEIYERAKSLAKEDMHEILLCQKAILPGNRHIRGRTGCYTIAGKRQPKLWI